MKKVLSFACVLVALSVIGCNAPSVKEDTKLEDLGNGQYMVDVTGVNTEMPITDIVRYYTSQGYKVVALSASSASNVHSVVIFSK